MATSKTYLSEPEKTRLEGMVDRHGICAVVDALSDICGLKAEHLRCNWQDEVIASNWDAFAKRLDTASNRIMKLEKVS